MKQEEKELLIKDLCGRLPYGVKVMLKCIHYPAIITTMDAQLGLVYHNGNSYKIEDCKPYLRSIADMTNEEQEVYCDVRDFSKHFANELVDFYNSHHIDYRGLIDMDLALKAESSTYDF